MNKRERIALLVGLLFVVFGLPLALGASWDQVGVRPPMLNTPSNTPVAQKGSANGAAAIVGDYPLVTEGCMRVECSLVGDAGVVMGIIPVDAGTFFPQANTRYVATLTTATGVRINNAACNSYLTGQGRIINEGAVLDLTTLQNPDGGVGNMAIHCCSLAASSASSPSILQFCPSP